MTVFLHLLAPLAGMLPATDQRRIENAFGIQATRLTFLSALLLLFPGGLSLILLIVSMFGSMTQDVSPQPSWLYFIGSILFVESFLRIFCAWKLEEPMGSLFVHFPVAFYRAIRRQSDPAYRQKERLMDQLLNACDEVKDISGPDHDLEVLSLLPKSHWNSLTGISYRGTWYGLIESKFLREGRNIRYQFLLKKAPEGTFFRTTCTYSPEEVRDLYRAQRRRDLGTWVQTFAPFWGLLDTRDQKRLELLYDFDCLKFSRITILALGTLAFFNFLASVMNAANGLATSADIALLLPSGYLLLESYFRWKDLKAGEPSGSILQYLVRPFASRLLED